MASNAKVFDMGRMQAWDVSPSYANRGHLKCGISDINQISVCFFKSQNYILLDSFRHQQIAAEGCISDGTIWSSDTEDDSEP